MSMKFQTQLELDKIEDPMLNNMWEVVMPKLDIQYLMPTGTFGGSWNGYNEYAPTVEEITFAPLGFKNSTDIRAGTTFYNIPLDKLDAKEANLTFYCDKQMKTQFYLKAWKETIFNEEDEFYYLPYQYKKDIFVYFYGLTETMASTTPVIQYCLKGCYPITQDDITLKYSKTADRFRITQKFNVDRVIIASYNSNGISGGIAAATRAISNLAKAVSPTNVIKNITSGFSKSIGAEAHKTADEAYGITYSPGSDSNGMGMITAAAAGALAKPITKKLGI